MRAHEYLFLFDAKDIIEDEHDEFLKAFADEGLHNVVLGHDLVIVRLPAEGAELDAEIDRVEKIVNEILVTDQSARDYVLPAPSGEDLIVNVMYQETQQVVSVLVDSAQFAAMTSQFRARRTYEQALVEAVAALYHDTDVPLNEVFGRDIEVQDVIEEIRFWSPEQARRFLPALWDEDEVLADVTVIAMADLPGERGQVEICFPGRSESRATFKVPVKAVGVDRDSWDDLALTPAAPEHVRTWAAIGNYTVCVERPEPDYEPGF